MFSLSRFYKETSNGAACIIHKPLTKYDDSCIHFRRHKFSPLVSRLMQVGDSRDGLRRPEQLVTVPAHTQSIVSTRFSYALLLRLRRSMKLTEMYEHNARQNEQPRRTFFIITHNDYELNFGEGGGRKTGVNLYPRAVAPAVVMKV